MGNQQKQLIGILGAELQKHQQSKKRKMWKVNELLVEEWTEFERDEKNNMKKKVKVPPLELMGKLELSLGLCEDLLCNVAQVLREGKEMEVKKEGEMRSGVNDVFWEQFLTEIPGSSKVSEVYLDRRNNVVR